MAILPTRSTCLQCGQHWSKHCRGCNSCIEPGRAIQSHYPDCLTLRSRSASVNKAHKVVRGGVAVFAVRDGKFVVGQRRGSHAAGTWSVPGGWMEYGESIEDAARRELAEEVGLGLENPRVVGVFSDFYPEAGKHCLVVWVIGNAVGEPAELEPDKFTNLRWCDMASLPSPLMPAWERSRAAGVRDSLERMLKEMAIDD